MAIGAQRESGTKSALQYTARTSPKDRAVTDEALSNPATRGAMLRFLAGAGGPAIPPMGPKGFIGPPQPQQMRMQGQPQQGPPPPSTIQQLPVTKTLQQTMPGGGMPSTGATVPPGNFNLLTPNRNEPLMGGLAGLGGLTGLMLKKLSSPVYDLRDPGGPVEPPPVYSWQMSPTGAQTPPPNIGGPMSDTELMQWLQEAAKTGEAENPLLRWLTAARGGVQP